MPLLRTTEADIRSMLKRSSSSDKLGFRIIIAFLILLAFYIPFDYTAHPWRGPGYCRNAIEAEIESNYFNNLPFYLEDADEIQSMHFRTLSDLWISSVVYQPKDLNKNEVTIVCKFEHQLRPFPWETFKGFDVYEGNKIDKLKSISSNNYHPIIWMGDWWFKGGEE